MEAPNRGKSGTVLACNRLARPRSMRSCRVRSIKEREDNPGQVTSLKQSSEIFELLAAVAGQFLQDGEGKCTAATEEQRTTKRIKVDEDGTFEKKRYHRGDLYLPQQTRRKKSMNSAKNAEAESSMNVDNIMSMGLEAKASSSSDPGSGSLSPKSPKNSVKLSIKSFTVPELLIDLPESATVASLKTAVLDATKDLLGGGLRIRVFMHGKKVPDEDATLAQVGISQTGKASSLGFMLEPANMSTSSSPKDALLALSYAAAQPSNQMSPRLHQKAFAGSAMLNERNGFQETCDLDAKFAPRTPSNQQTESIIEPYFQVTKRFEETSSLVYKASYGSGMGNPLSIKSKGNTITGLEIVQQGHGPSAIIPHSSNDGDGLALVSMSQKQLSIEGSKRRIRRPFSIAEVEALVYAVEKLGLGRWRDVKLWAFDQAKHRTYVDLKDKWKTLVHTARIAPHQRRGETVPQELLERVMRAQNYWSAQQAKQQAYMEMSS